MVQESAGETLEQFRRSFNYGSRTDLLFKFLGSGNLTDQEVAEFFRALLEKLGDAFDTGDYQPTMQHAFQWQVRGYTPREGPPTGGAQFLYDSSAWAPLTKALSHARVGLLSTGGVYIAGEDPMGPSGPTQEEAIPRINEFLQGPAILTSIPTKVDRSRLRIRHLGYDVRGSVRDFNVVFPIDRLEELQAKGVIGELAEQQYSFVGATSQLRLLKEAPEWAERFKRDGLDALLLVGA